MARYLRADGKEIRLGTVQRARLEAAAVTPQRCGPGNPTFKALVGHGFCTSAQHISTRTGMPTLDRLFTITSEGERYLREGRER